MSAVEDLRGRPPRDGVGGADGVDGADGALADDDLDASTPPPGRGGPAGVVPRATGWLMAVGGAVGFFAAFVLTVERFRLAEDPTGYTPSCSINPVISCGSVMKADQAALFGFPNPLLGIGAFAVMTTLGLLVVSRTPLPRWVWAGLQVGITLGTVMVVWLISQSLYSIHALCPYCMVVWAVVIPMFWSITATNLERGVLPTPAGARGAVVALSDYRIVAVVASFALVLALIGVQFWDYWRTLL